MLATRQRFGKFVLLEPIDSSGLGTEVRAAKLGPAGLEKIVTVLQLSPAVSQNAEVARSLMEQAKVAAQLQSPNVVKIYGIGKVESVYYISYEFVEGKSLKEVFARCRREGFPLSVDHGLLIASKVCSALEYAHGRRTPGGARYFHGLLTPSSVVVSYEGEVRVRGFGYWPSRVRDGGVLTEEDTRYLAPEQVGGKPGDTRCDIFAVGAILFELLTGQPLFQGRRAQDLESQVAHARLWSPAGEDDSLPKPIVQILQRALAQDAGRRYAEVQEMRKAIDILLFSGDFTPTTFNLAFFMHSLFRDDIERETRQFREEREANFQEFVSEEPAAAPPSRPPAAAQTARMAAVAPPARAIPTPAPPAAPAPPPARTPAPVALAQTPFLESPPSPTDAPAAFPVTPPPQHEATPHHEPPVPPPEPTVARDLGHPHKKAATSPAPLLAGVAALVVLLGGGYYFGLGPGTRFWRRPAAPPTPPTPTAEALALARVRELEQKLAGIEAERAAAEARAAEEAKVKVEAQAAARGQKVDPAAVQRAQEEARRKAQAEQEKKVQEERRRLEDAKADEARLAEEQRRAEEQRAEEAARGPSPVAAAPGPLAAAASAPPPVIAVPSPSAPAATARPSIAPGTLVSVDDPGVIAPVVERAPQPSYPPVAYRQKVEGVVELNVLVDEKGTVIDAQVTTGAGVKAGLNEAAIESVKRRRYRPAVKDGVPVKVWIKVRVKFELPR